MSLGYIFGGFNLTSYVEGNPNQDIYWRELGWCGYCSEKVSFDNATDERGSTHTFRLTLSRSDVAKS